MNDEDEGLKILTRRMGKAICQKMDETQDRVVVKEFASDFLDGNRDLVINGLADLILREVDLENDRCRLARFIERRPEIKEFAERFEKIAALFRIGTWFVIACVPSNEVQQCFKAYALILDLRARQAQKELEILEDEAARLEPLIEIFGDLPAGELERLAEERTTETLRRLESGQ